MLRRLLGACLALVLLGFALYITSASQAHASGSVPDTEKVHAGQEIFQKNCFQCHSTLEGQYSFGPSLYAELKKPHPKKTPAEIRSILKNGKGKMPSFAGKLTPQDTDDLIAYLHTL